MPISIPKTKGAASVVTDYKNLEVTKAEILLHVFTHTLGIYWLVFNFVG